MKEEEDDRIKQNNVPDADDDTEDYQEYRSGKGLKDFFLEVGLIASFAVKFFRELFKRPFEFRELVKQSYEIGYRSLPLVGITGFIMGVVLTIQSRPTLVEFGAEAWLPAMVGISIIREIGPVITSLICAGRVGSGIGAELASMRVTEQIDAMEVSGTNPFKYIVVTRVLATTLMIPLLALYSEAIGLIGSYTAVTINGNFNFGLFFLQVFKQVEFLDFFPAFIKTFFFGATIGIISCYMGYNATKGTEGVGKAANSSVVVASLMIFVLDMIAAQITDLMQ